jgi:hypothetical protein
MRNDVILAGVALTVAALGLVGCGPQEAPAPAFAAGTGQAKNVVVYPAGPYGVGIGSVIANYDFVGYVNATADISTMQAIQLADFYNPDGRNPDYQPASAAEDTRLFPAGSQYGEGLPKPTALAIDIASVWCGPCNLEAQCELPGLHAKYAPCGGQFLLQLADGPTPGTAALPKHLSTWATKYKENFPTAIDPSSKLMTLAEADAFPANIIVDTTTMTIVEVVAGVPPAAYWAKFQKLLADPTCPSKQTVPAKPSSCP